MRGRASTRWQQGTRATAELQAVCAGQVRLASCVLKDSSRWQEFISTASAQGGVPCSWYADVCSAPCSLPFWWHWPAALVLSALLVVVTREAMGG